MVSKQEDAHTQRGKQHWFEKLESTPGSRDLRLVLHTSRGYSPQRQMLRQADPSPAVNTIALLVLNTAEASML